MNEKGRARFHRRNADSGARPDRARPPRRQPRAACERAIFENIRESWASWPERIPRQKPLPAASSPPTTRPTTSPPWRSPPSPARSLIPYPLLANEVIEQIGEGGCNAALHLAVPPHAATHAGHLATASSAASPTLKIVGRPVDRAESIDRSSSRLQDAGVDAVVTNFPDALQHLRDLAVAPASAVPAPRTDSRIIRTSPTPSVGFDR